MMAAGRSPFLPLPGPGPEPGVFMSIYGDVFRTEQDRDDYERAVDLATLGGGGLIPPRRGTRIYYIGTPSAKLVIAMYILGFRFNRRISRVLAWIDQYSGNYLTSVEQ